jgi:hypothetical protein
MHCVQMIGRVKVLTLELMLMCDKDCLFDAELGPKEGKILACGLKRIPRDKLPGLPRCTFYFVDFAGFQRSKSVIRKSMDSTVRD